MHTIVFALLMVVLAACSGAPKRAEISADQLQAALKRFGEDVARESAENARTFLHRIADRAATKPAEQVVINILCVSGGGSKGAFGAGILRGWGEIKEGEFVRPEFDIVTGISTGSIIASFAFIGTEQTYAAIDELYRNPGKDWAVKRSWAVLGGKSSMLDGTGLWNEIREKVSGDLVRQIADGARQKRLMLLGTINADLGRQRVWNGTRMAVEAEKSGDASRLTTTIIASASYPGAFPAVEIDGNLHIDGGMGALFIAGVDASWLRRAGQAWSRHYGSTRKTPKIRFWLLINNPLRVSPTTMTPSWLGTMTRGMDIGDRISSEILVGAYMRSAEVAASKSGWEMEVRYVAIPDLAKLPQSKSAFDKEYMRKLSDIGRTMGKDPASWQTSVPEFQWPKDVPLQPQG